MATTQTVLHGKDTATQGELYMSFELGDKSWKQTLNVSIRCLAARASAWQVHTTIDGVFA